MTLHEDMGDDGAGVAQEHPGMSDLHGEMDLGLILVVDDDASTRDLARRALRQAGFEVAEAGDGEQGLAECARLHPDVVLLDAMMPVLDGFAACARLQALPGGSQTAVIMITALDDPASVERAFAAGASDYVVKPIHWTVLCERIRRLLQGRRAERILRESELRFRSVVESANDAIIIADGDGSVLSWNPAAEAIFGYAEDEALGTPLVRLMPERYRLPHLHALERAHAAGLSHPHGATFEFHGLRKDGREFPLELSLSSWQSGATRWYGGIIRDMTDRQRAEEQRAWELRRAALRSEVSAALLEGTSISSIVQRCAEALVRHLDVAMARIWTLNSETLGLELQATAGLAALLEGPPNRVPASQRIAARIMQERRPHLTNALPDDPDLLNRMWVEQEGLVALAGYPLLVEADRPVGVLTLLARAPLATDALDALATIADAIAQGIERVRVAAAVRKSEQEYRALFEQANDAILIFQPEDETVLDVNEHACAIYGFSREEFVGTSLQTLSQNVSRGKYFIRKVVDDGLADGFETVQFRADGTALHLLINAARIEFRGRPAILSINRDITAQKRAEEEQRALERKLQETQKLQSLGVLASGIAHDFNNLLGAILGNASLALLDLPHDSPLRPTIEAIESAAQRAADLPRQLLAYAGKGRVSVQPLDLNALVAEMARLLKAALDGMVTLELDLAPHLALLEGDATQLRQVVMNLITNAADALRGQGGRLVLRTSMLQANHAELAETLLGTDLPTGTYIMLEVADTGPGMDAETQARIFEPFFTTKSTGRGLGLAAVLGIVRTHRGALSVRSAPGDGTTFRILFPPTTEVPDAPATTEGTREGWRGRGLVLVVDDEEGVRTTAARILRHVGFTVLIAAGGREGIALFRAHASSLACVLLDAMLPDMSGADVYRELWQIRPEVPVVLMSGYTEMPLTLPGGDDGLAGFLQKPFSASELRELMLQALGTSER